MKVTQYNSLPDDPHIRNRWNQLAGDNPQRGYEWLTAWQRHYVANADSTTSAARLEDSTTCLLVVHDGAAASQQPDVIAILPCYVQHSLLRGRVLRMLGDGEVCSDHLGLLADRAQASEAADAIAAHLAECDDWDAVHFEAIDQSDGATRAIFTSLGRRGLRIAATEAQQCWAIELPDTWDEFLALQSKSHRKQLRRAERRVADFDHLRWDRVQTAEQLEIAWQTLVELHQRRRISLGEPGCFASPRYAAFHREAAQLLLDAGQLRMSTLSVDGTPVAAEYHFAGGGTTYAYQGGVDPERLADEPGRMSLICTIKQAIDEGCSRFDLMRGGEPYKPHWRASPSTTLDLTAVPPRMLARLRDGARTGLRNARAKAKQLAGMVE